MKPGVPHTVFHTVSPQKTPSTPLPHDLSFSKVAQQGRMSCERDVGVTIVSFSHCWLMVSWLCVQLGRYPDVWGGSEDDDLALNPTSMSGRTLGLISPTKTHTHSLSPDSFVPKYLYSDADVTVDVEADVHSLQMPQTTSTSCFLCNIILPAEKRLALRAELHFDWITPLPELWSPQ